MTKCLFLLIAILILPYHSVANCIKLLECGILDERDATKRFWILQRTHQLAITHNSTVDYIGIDSLMIEIPKDAVSIPINQSCDFKNLKLIIINKYKDFELFTIKQKPQKIDLSPINIQKGDFSDVPSLNKGLKMLYIKDNTPWVEERMGYGCPVYRKDIILIKAGIPLNNCIESYNDPISKPEFLYVDVTDRQIKLSNIEFIRAKTSLFKTYCISIDFQNNVKLSNISIKTPDSNLYGDRAITIKNSSNIILEDIKIEGSYSQQNKYGYGIALDNIWNISFHRLFASAKWGIFGNNNINTAYMFNSDINRFDVHCYGRNFFFYNTTFRERYNQFSSFFGCVKFLNCHFINFIPVLIEDSYQTYTPFDVYIQNCTYTTNKMTSMLIKIGNSKHCNKRSNPGALTWPNLYINNFKVYESLSLRTLLLYSTSSDDKIALYGDLNINISDVYSYRELSIDLCNKYISSKVNLTAKNCKVGIEDF